MNAKDFLIEQIEREFKLSRKTLAAIPEGHADWKPHEKSMSLGRLAGHIAESADWGINMLTTNPLKLEALDMKACVVTNAAEALALLDRSVPELLKLLRATPESQLAANWKLSWETQVYVDSPLYEALETWVPSHMIHHRGQLSVYLRLLGIPVPGIYGPSADEHPSPVD